ncbi:glycosyl hydrolase, family 43 [Bacteroides ovatus]|nr:glycosyl hydrolase, family 43 [Bacteroides ovatus]
MDKLILVLTNKVCMKKLSFLIATALCIMACSGGSDEQPDGPGNGNGNGGGGSTPNPVSFSNPIVGKQLPDPTIIHAADGNFYLYVTQQDNIYIPIYKSTNMTQWTYAGAAFLQKPNWQPDTRLWAPDINYINGKYVLYYTLGHWDLPKNSCIGVAVSDSPVGPFTDHGKLLDYNSGTMQCIDPCYFEDNGKKYLFWGSYNSTSKGYEGGIRYVELSADGLSIKGAVSEKIAGPSIEGIMVHKRGNYYYLFGSTGSCCEEERSTYRVVVGRSKNIEGPYVGKNGTVMKENSSYNEVVLQGNNLFAGTGHNSEIITDDEGNDWFFYHAWQKAKIDNGRQLMCDRIQWSSDGWPYITNGTPASVSRAPVFKNEEEKE